MLSFYVTGDISSLKTTMKMKKRFLAEFIFYDKRRDYDLLAFAKIKVGDNKI